MDENIRTKTGSILSDLRKLAEKKQFDVAEYLGVSQQAYQKYEAGTREANYETLVKLADFYGVTTDYLLGRETPQQTDIIKALKAECGLSDIEETVVRAFLAVPKENRKAFIDGFCGEVDRQLGKKYITLRCSTLSVCAGNGLDLSDEHFEDIEVLDTPESFKATFAVPVTGDSMEPTYPDGSILLVRKQPSVPVGKIGIFGIDNGQAVVKELAENALISHNKAFDSIPLDRIEKCFGEVLGTAVIKPS